MIRRFELAAGLLWLLAAPLLAGKPKEVVARWEELAPLVEKREIETVLANGVHLRGRVEKLLPEALEVRVKRTSDPNVVPRGRTRVPRELISEMTARWRQGPGRILLAATFPIALGYFVLAQGVDFEKAGTGALLATWSAGAVVGYLLGMKIDERRLHIRINHAQRGRLTEGPGFHVSDCFGKPLLQLPVVVGQMLQMTVEAP